MVALGSFGALVALGSLGSLGALVALGSFGALVALGSLVAFFVSTCFSSPFVSDCSEGTISIYDSSSKSPLIMVGIVWEDSFSGSFLLCKEDFLVFLVGLTWGGVPSDNAFT